MHGTCCFAEGIGVLVEIDLEINGTLLAAAAGNNVCVDGLQLGLNIGGLLIDKEFHFVMDLTLFLARDFAAGLHFVLGSGNNLSGLVVVGAWPLLVQLECEGERILPGWHHPLSETVEVLVDLEELILPLVSFNLLVYVRLIYPNVARATPGGECLERLVCTKYVLEEGQPELLALLQFSQRKQKEMEVASGGMQD